MATEGRLEGIEAFVTAVEKGSFSAAAGELGVAKSTISKKVSRLEERLGSRLFARTTRSVRLTPAGAGFYERVSGMVVVAEEAAREVAQLQLEPRGRFRISAPMTLGRSVVTPVVAEFMQENPSVEVELDLSDRNVDITREGFDLAIRVGVLADSSMIARRLSETHSVVAGSPAYFERHGIPRLPEDLVEHECLLYSYVPDPRRWHFRDGVVRVQGRLLSNSGSALVAAAQRGLGVTKAPDFLFGEALADGTLVQVLKEHYPPPSPIHALYPERRFVPTALRMLLDALEGRMASCK